MLKLLDGESVVPNREHEATNFAISLVGVARVLAMLTMEASLSANIGIRMDFSNQVDRIVNQLSGTYDPLKTEYAALRVSIYTDEQLKEIGNSPDVVVPEV